MIFVFLLNFLLGCSGDSSTEDSTPREIYNNGTALLTSQDFDAAAESLLSSRDKAATDAELRQYSAYNLALSHALNGAKLESEDPEKASAEYAHFPGLASKIEFFF